MLKTKTAKVDLSLEIEVALANFFKVHIEQAKVVGTNYERLWKELERLVRSGGKRTRPKIMLLTYRAFGGNNFKGAVSVATALELFHQFLLIHDDIIDRDFVRYGIPNIAGSYKELYKEVIRDEGDRVHHANSAAMLGGNLMLGSLHQLINDADIDIKDKIKLNDILNRAHFEVGGGELLDVESAFKETSLNEALSIARYKTAGYSFIAPVTIGATLAGASQLDIDKLTEFAENLGEAFQLNDDLLGMFGDEVETGKSNSTDLLEGKGTYLVASFFKNASEDEIKIFKKAFGKANATDEDIKDAKQLLIDSGAKKRTEETINEFEVAAMKALESLNLKHEFRVEYVKLVDKCMARK